MQLIPYLNFNGNCTEAFDFYAKALNGKITARMTYRQGPKEMCDQMPAKTLDHVMHSQLESDGATLMGADGPPPHTPQSSGVTINVMVDDVNEAERIFAALAEGGTIGMPIEETFWAQRWGSLHDRYGKSWMVNCMKAE